MKPFTIRSRLTSLFRFNLARARINIQNMNARKSCFHEELTATTTEKKRAASIFTLGSSRCIIVLPSINTSFIKLIFSFLKIKYEAHDPEYIADTSYDVSKCHTRRLRFYHSVYHRVHQGFHPFLYRPVDSILHN